MKTDSTDSLGRNRPDRTETGAILLTADELAELLSISTRSLWRLRSSGKLPHPLRIGGSVRWRRQEIEQWVASGCPPMKRDQE